jgi:caffeoyl-CoA O-methyltransferase
MSFVPKEIEDYCIHHSSKPSQVAQDLMNHTQTSVHGSNMLIGEMEGSVLKFLIKLGRVKSIIELGTFTGYSALIMAEALPEDGLITTIDVNPGPLLIFLVLP